MHRSTLVAGAVGIAALLGLFPLSCSSDTSPAEPEADGGAVDTGTSPADTRVGDTGSPPTDSPTDGPAGDSAAALARGEYLVKHLLFCGDCHTTPGSGGAPSSDPTDFLAGGRDFQVPGEAGVGHVYSRNLTSDVATGIGKWTLEQVKTAISKGLDDGGKPLFPIMPYSMYGNLTDADLTAVATFVKSLPAKSNTVPEPTVSVPGPAPVYPDAVIPHTTLASGDPKFAAAEHGRYLASVSCIECHTQDGPSRGPDFSKAFGGGRQFQLGPLTSTSANLTPDPTSMLATWTEADIIATLKTDLEQGTGRHLCPPMPGGPTLAGGLVDGDLSDIAAFIHTLPPVANGPFPCAAAGCCGPTGDAGTDAPDGD